MEPKQTHSGLNDEALAMKAAQAGAQDYLVKGNVDRDSLVRSIRCAIERHCLLADLEHRKHELRQMTEAATHDLQTPLASLRGAVHALREELGKTNDEPIEKWLQRIESSTDRMAARLDDLMVYTKAGPGIERARALGAATVLSDLMTAEDVLDAVRDYFGSPAELAGPTNMTRLLRILVVDDEIEHCELIERGLQRPGRETMEVAFCHTVADACRLLEQERFGCVLLDHNLPDGHGTDILERMQDRLLATPVIGLSTSQDPDVIISNLRGGCVEFIHKHEAFEGDTLRRQVFAAIASFKRRAIALLLDRRQTGRGVEASQEALIASARVDPLMGILNRAALEDVHQDLHKRMSASKASYACCLADLDNFKQYNDRYGHIEGDTALRSVALALSSTLRKDDFVARYGGEEIVILLSNIDEGNAVAAAERLRERVVALNLRHGFNAGHGRVTLSIGIAVFDPVTSEDKRAILERADQALYRAKHAGRNQVVLAPSAANKERRCA